MMQSLIAISPPNPPTDFSTAAPPSYIDKPWGTLVEEAKVRQLPPATFYARLSMCAGLWFWYTGGPTPSSKRPVDLNLRWQRLDDGRYILADFAEQGFWDDGLESLLARAMMAVLIPLENIPCSVDVDGAKLHHSSILRSKWENTHSQQEWDVFITELENAYEHSFWGPDARYARILATTMPDGPVSEAMPRPEEIKRRFGTPSYPDGSPALIATALIRAEATIAKLREENRSVA